jgi:hypothetical protein
MRFAELTQIALLGTERQDIPPATGTGAVDHLLRQIDRTRRERALLSLAVVSGWHERIGGLPARDLAPPPQPAPMETRERAGERAGSLLLRLLGGDFPEVLPEWLGLAAERGLLSPPEALPPLLDKGASNSGLREVILPVLGERGRWLAVQNPEWAWAIGAAGENETVWHAGERAARALFLQRLRRVNPGRARDLLAATWKEEPPEDRALFIGALDTGLSAEDEPFLEAALDDKRKEVRRMAAQLLARLPGSALVKRQTERAMPMLKFVPAALGGVLRLKKGKPANIEVILPAGCDKTMERDGVEPKPPQGVGEKAWWLIQMLEAVPLDLWTREWKTAPEEIVAALEHCEFKAELLEGWTRAAVRQSNPAWAEPLLDASLEWKRFDKLGGLIGAMPPAQREACVTKLLADRDDKTREIRGRLVMQCGHGWSAAFSREVLAFMRRETAGEQGDWALRNQFKEFALRLAPEVLAEAPAEWPTGEKSWEFWSKGVEEFLAMAQFRTDLRYAFG